METGFPRFLSLIFNWFKFSVQILECFTVLYQKKITQVGYKILILTLNKQKILFKYRVFVICGYLYGMNSA